MRRRFAAAGLFLVVVVLAALVAVGVMRGGEERGVDASSPLTVTVPGDLNGDGTVSDQETQAAADAQANATKLASLLTPKDAKDVSQILVTPPGKDWWGLIGTLSDEMRLYSFKQPAGVNWYALTWGKAYSPPGGDVAGVHTYPAVHVAFPDAAQAYSWVSNDSGSGRGVAYSIRGSVVTIVPSYVDPYKEPLPKKLADVADLKQPVGFWSIDFSKRTRDEAEDAIAPPDYREFWSALGFAKAKWWAVTEDPRRWVGQTRGYDPAAVNIPKALAFDSTLAKSRYTEDMPAISDHLFVTNTGIDTDDPFDKTVHDDAGDRRLVPMNQPDDADLILTLSTGFRGAYTGSSAVYNEAPVSAFSMWMVGEVLTIEPWFDRSVVVTSGAPTMSVGTPTVATQVTPPSQPWPSD